MLLILKRLFNRYIYMFTNSNLTYYFINQYTNSLDSNLNFSEEIVCFRR
jgi:hypothetical protein